MSRLVLRALLGAAALGSLCTSGDASAQIAGTTARPLPNVMLLVDTSGSMERMVDNSLPAQNRDPITGGTLAAAPFNACAPGTASNPNRWGMLLQALTGNLQPYYSCDVVDRTSVAFKNEFKINNKTVYDADYFLPYHRPLTGATAPTACTLAPYYLPGAAPGTGVGVSSLGGGGDSHDLPPNAFTEVTNAHLKGQYAAGSGLLLPANACTFEQAADGQLDASRDYVRFGLMTFDNDTSAGTGVVPSSTTPPTTLDTTNPFLGQWSYVKSASNPLVSSTFTPLGFGMPAGCPTSSPFEVGARHSAAPPWEGRMVPFPPANGDTFDIESTNDAIQKVLLSTRPYGATPIEGMLEDARDYFLYNPTGPNGTVPDPYVAVGCRDQYIILLTDGAPNLDLRPGCEGTGGNCPFNKAAVITDALSSAATVSRKVNTYVIGFSVNGAGDVKFTNDGFPLLPAPIKSCKQWYTSLGGTPGAMRAACTAPATAPPKDSTAAACCELNEIAYWGTALHDVGPFFAETQADLVLSFGRVLGGVAKTATTRTLPGYAPAVTVAGTNRTASFIASFIPNTQKVWSGEIDRERSFCVGAVPTPQTPQSVTEGDSYSANLAAQAVGGNRRFISVVADTTAGPASYGTVVDSARTIRPYAPAVSSDGIPPFGGVEVSGKDDALKGATNWAEAMDIQPDVGGFSPSCKRSRGVEPVTRASIDIPPLPRTQCTDVMWDFATAHYGSVKPSGPWEFNVRCSAVGNLSAGFCSVSGIGCTVADPNACAPPAGVVGEVCVPKCSALGAIYRSSPVLVGTPNQFLRDDAYQAFAAAHSNRRPTMYVASADGILHAFKSLASTTFDNGDFEMWAFVPPAVLPKIATNYPTGQQILLDGTPAVKDTVWDRSTGVNANTYHTTLVAGMGSGGPGYYALNVSDPDCGGYPTSAQGCIASYTPASTKAAAFGTTTPAVGPHFLWQLTDVPFVAGDPAKKTRKARDNTQMVALFGNQSGTPVITTLQVDPDGAGPRQIGVAILPGGIDGPPVKNKTCLRAMDSGIGYNPVNFDFTDPAFPRRTMVRQWGASCAATDPVAGRGVTVVRLDTGEIIRHFGRATQDVPKSIMAKGVVTDTPFDSPIIGTPVVYPNIVGATAQKAFVGDADGSVWRLDLSQSNPAAWTATLFADLITTGLTPSCGSPAQCAAASQPITTPPVLSLDPSGGIVINVATGDQENLVVSTDSNYVYSIQEARPVALGTPSRATVKWYNGFTAGERVSGPMTVFDRTLYFATYTPSVPGGAAVCTEGGRPTLWGMDFFNANGPVTSGGAPRWCKLGSVDPVTGACLVGLTQNEDPTLFDPTLKGAIIPGVTIRAAQSCAQFDATPGDPAITALTSTKFDIFFGATNSRASGGTGTPQAARPETPLTRPLPRTTASVDAWALVVD
jgi:type IV pilus assembly protein PilY1